MKTAHFNYKYTIYTIDFSVERRTVEQVRDGGPDWEPNYIKETVNIQEIKDTINVAVTNLFEFYKENRGTTFLKYENLKKGREITNYIETIVTTHLDNDYSDNTYEFKCFKLTRATFKTYHLCDVRVDYTGTLSVKSVSKVKTEVPHESYEAFEPALTIDLAGDVFFRTVFN